MANPFDSSSAAAAAEARAPPSVTSTSVDTFLALLASQSAEALSVLSDIRTLSSSDSLVPVITDSILYIYARTSSGTVVRFTPTGAADGTPPTPVQSDDIPHHIVASIAANTPAIHVLRIAAARPASAIVADWSFPPSCVVSAIKDPFDKNLNYACSSVWDAQRLVEDMLPLAQRYEFFGDTPLARKAMHSFWMNYDAILTGLYELLSMLRKYDADVAGDTQVVTRGVAAANDGIALLMDAGVRAGPRPPVRPDMAPLTDVGVPPGVAASAITLLMSHSAARGLRSPIRLKLLYSAARDGMTAKDYHARVDGKPRCLTLACGDGFWFGGFLSSPLPAATGDGAYARDEHACVMTITNPHGIAPTVYPVKPDCVHTAALSHLSCGPVFGGRGTSNEFYINSPFASNTGGAFPTCYEDTTGKAGGTFAGLQSGWKATQVVVAQVEV